jgi:hypothetical protein
LLHLANANWSFRYPKAGEPAKINAEIGTARIASKSNETSSNWLKCEGQLQDESVHCSFEQPAPFPKPPVGIPFMSKKTDYDLKPLQVQSLITGGLLTAGPTSSPTCPWCPAARNGTFPRDGNFEFEIRFTDPNYDFAVPNVRSANSYRMLPRGHAGGICKGGWKSNGTAVQYSGVTIFSLTGECTNDFKIYSATMSLLGESVVRQPPSLRLGLKRILHMGIGGMELWFNGVESTTDNVPWNCDGNNCSRRDFSTKLVQVTFGDYYAPGKYPYTD